MKMTEKEAIGIKAFLDGDATPFAIAHRPYMFDFLRRALDEYLKKEGYKHEIFKTKND